MTSRKNVTLVVLAHPGDESEGPVAEAIVRAVRCSTVCIVYAFCEPCPDSRGSAQDSQLTESGLARTCRELCIKRWLFLSPLRWALGELVEVLRALRPRVLITFEHAPDEASPDDHALVGLLAVEAVADAANPSYFPQHLAWGLAPLLPADVTVRLVGGA